MPLQLREENLGNVYRLHVNDPLYAWATPLSFILLSNCSTCSLIFPNCHGQLTTYRKGRRLEHCQRPQCFTTCPTKTHSCRLSSGLYPDRCTLGVIMVALCRLMA